MSTDIQQLRQEKKLNKHCGNPHWRTNAKLLGKQSVEMSFLGPGKHSDNVNIPVKMEFFFRVETGDKTTEGKYKKALDALKTMPMHFHRLSNQ